MARGRYIGDDGQPLLDPRMAGLIPGPNGAPAYGTAGYWEYGPSVPMGSNVINQGGYDWIRSAAPLNNPKLNEYSFQGRPFSEFSKYDPTYGWLTRADAQAAVPQLNEDLWSVLGPGVAMAAFGGLAGLHGAAVGAPSLPSSLGQATGLTSATPAAGGVNPSYWSMVAGDSAAADAEALQAAMGGSELAGGETFMNVMDTVPQNLGGVASEGLFPGGFKMPFPTPAPFPQGGSNEAPGSLNDPAWQAIPMGGQSGGNAGALSRLLSGLGIDVSPDTLGLVGSGLGLLGGYASARDSAGRVSDLNNQMLAMAERDRADRMPYLSQSADWLNNPSSFWNGSVGQEIARQTARQIGGARQENLFDSQTGQALVMSALAPQWLNAVTQTANLGLRSTAPLSALSDIGLQSASAQGRPGAVLGAGVADLFGTGGTSAISGQNDLLRQLLMGGGPFSPNSGGYRLG